jgi:O-antigen ligase
MSGRTELWDRAWRAFLERPILGAGANAFGAAVDPRRGTQGSAHNSALALLVEQGVVGLTLFTILLATCAWAIVGLPAKQRLLWSASMLAWLIFAMAHDAHTDRVTWVLFGLLAAESAATGRSALAARESPVPAGGPLKQRLDTRPAPAHAAYSLTRR